MSKVSVIVPNWNGKNYLEKCLLSLKGQTFEDLDVIVIDNGSSDGSIPFLRRIFPEIRLRAFRHNTGFCHAVNTGIRMSRSDYVILLNNDTEADPSMVEELVNARKVANRIEEEREKAIAYHDTVEPKMEEIRYHIDKLELTVADELWTLPKYRELLFIR